MSKDQEEFVNEGTTLNKLKSNKEKIIKNNFFEKLNQNKIYSGIFSILVTIYSLVNLIIYFFSKKEKKENSENDILCVILFCFCSLCSLLNFSKLSKIVNFLKIYFLYFLFSIIHFQMNSILSNLSDSTKSNMLLLSQNVIFLFSLSIFKMIWTLTPLNKFYFVLVTNLIEIPFLYYFLYMKGYFQNENFVGFMIAYNFSQFLSIIFSKFISLKNIELCKYEILKINMCKNKKIINNFKNGYLKIKNNKVIESNTFLEKEFSQFSEIERILPFVFTNLKVINEEFANTKHSPLLINVGKEPKYSNVPDFTLNTVNNNESDLKRNSSKNHYAGEFENIELISEKLLNNKTLFSQFDFFGKSLMINQLNKIISLEILVKIDEDNNIEMILNDITKEELKNGTNEFIIHTGQFLHDFKNPLISIHNEITEAKDQTEALVEFTLNEIECRGNPERANLEDFNILLDKFDYIKDMSDYCQSMIGSYEDFSKSILKPQSLKIKTENFDLIKMLNNINRMMQIKVSSSNKNIQFILNFDSLKLSDNSLIMGSDENKLKRVLINILTNAEKFTTIGSVSLSINEIIRDEKIFYQFEIKDTGSGMNNEELEKLFSPFVSNNNNENNANGCGLGLLIVKEILDKLGEGLKITSELSIGTTVIFLIENRRLVESNENASQMTETVILSNSYFNRIEQIEEIFKMEPTFSSRSMASTKKYIAKENKNLNDIFSKFRKPTLPKIKRSGISSVLLHVPYQNIKCLNSYSSNEYCLYLPNLSVVNEINFYIFAAEIQNNFNISYSDKVVNIKKSSNYLSPSNDNISSLRNSPGDSHYLNTTQLLKNRLTSFTGGDTKITSDKISLRNDNLSSHNNFKNLDTKYSHEILIIDNENSIRSCYKNLINKIASLENLNIKVDEANDGLTGLSQMFNKANLNSDNYRLIICDDLMTFLDGNDMYKVLIFIIENRLSKSKYLEDIIKNLVFCTSDVVGLQSKIKSAVRVCEKPISFDTLRKLIL